MKKILLLLSVFTFHLSLLSAVTAQNKFTLSGYVKDSVSGESLIAASVFVKATSQGAYTNEYGYYSMSLAPGNYEIVFSYVGYKTVTQSINLSADTRVNINLPSSANTLKEIIVETEKKDANVQNADVGKYELSVDKIKTLPAIFGEVDIMKTIQLLPGVQSGTEGTSGFYVRGGGPEAGTLLRRKQRLLHRGGARARPLLDNDRRTGKSPVGVGARPLDYNQRKGARDEARGVKPTAWFQCPEIPGRPQPRGSTH